MKKLLLALAAVASLGTGFYALTITDAEAACPPGTRYQCFQTYSGKMNCGCY